MILIFKKTFWAMFIVLIIAISWVIFFHADWMAVPPKFDAIPVSDKDPTPPNPDRPYFDQCGNQYDYKGNLINKGNGCLVQPTILETPVTNIVQLPSDFQGK